MTNSRKNQENSSTQGDFSQQTNSIQQQQIPTSECWIPLFHYTTLELPLFLPAFQKQQQHDSIVANNKTKQIIQCTTSSDFGMIASTLMEFSARIKLLVQSSANSGCTPKLLSHKLTILHAVSPVYWSNVKSKLASDQIMDIITDLNKSTFLQQAIQFWIHQYCSIYHSTNSWNKAMNFYCNYSFNIKMGQG